MAAPDDEGPETPAATGATDDDVTASASASADVDGEGDPPGQPHIARVADKVKNLLRPDR